MYEETEFDQGYSPIAKKEKKKKWWKWLLLLLLLLLVMFLMYASYIYGLFKYFTVGKISPANDFKNIVWAENLKGEDSGEVNVLLLGMRGKDELEPYITNAMMVVNLDTATNEVNLISIPRDFWIPVTGYGHTKANSVYKVARLRNGDDQEKNLQFCRQTYGEILGIDINYAFLIDFSGFEEMIDAMGTVKVQISDEEASHYPFLLDPDFSNTKTSENSDIYQFNGKQSLIFIRWPENAVPDFDRIKRQHIFMHSIRNQYLNLNVLLNPIKTARMMKIGAKNIRTDFHLWELLSFMEKTKNVGIDDINKYYLNNTEGTDGGLLSENKTTTNGIIYLPISGTDNFSEIQNWTKSIISK